MEGILHWPRLSSNTSDVAAVSAVIVIVTIIQASNGTFHVRPTDVVRIGEWMSFLLTPDIFGYKGTSTIVAGVTWTLKYEWIYYLSIPALSLLFGVVSRMSRIAIISLAIVGLVYVSFFYFVSQLPYLPFRLLSLDYRLFSLFFLGMLAMEIANFESVARLLRTSTASIAGIVALLLLLWLDFGGYWPIEYLFLFTVYAPIVAGNKYFGAVSAECSIGLGNLTYAMYLTHGIVLFVFFQTFSICKNSDLVWYLFPVVASLVVVVSSLVHYKVENAGISVGKMLIKKYVYGSPAVSLPRVGA